MWPFMTDLVSSFIHSCHMYINAHYILWLNSNPLYRCATFCLPTYSLTNIWVVPTFWHLRIMQLWAFVYKFLCRQFCSFGCTLRSRMSGLYGNSTFNFSGNHQSTPIYTKASAPFHFPTSNVCEFQFLHILRINAYYCLFLLLVFHYGCDLYFHND